MQNNELTAALLEKAKAVLASGKAQKVVAWRRGLFDDDISPSVFKSVEDLEKNFVYDAENCGTLAKYLVKVTRAIETAKTTTKTNNAMAKQRDPNAVDKPIPTEVVAVFLTPRDKRGYTELLKEHRITGEDVIVLDVPGEDGLGAERFEEVEKLERMTSDERHEFWKKEFSRCIRCNACRDVCPACTCEKCVFGNNALYTSQKVAQTSFEESLYHIIRAWHVAGRCVDCGECSRVCPEHIPLYLLNRKFIKDIDELYGPYVAGSDMETKPPMLTYQKADAEPSVIYERDKSEGAKGGQ